MRKKLLLFGAGLNLSLINFILVQRCIVSIRQAELAVFIFSLSYFTGISLGVFFSDKLSESKLRSLFPLFLFSQIAVLILGQAGFYTLQNTLGDQAAWIAAFAVISLCFTWFYAVFLPSAASSIGLRQSYSIEIAGSITGLLLTPLFLKVSYEALLGAYFIILLGLGLLIQVQRLSLFILLISIFIWITNHSLWDQTLSAWFYRQKYPDKKVERVLFSKQTPYHKIEVASRENGRLMLFLNGKRQFSEDKTLAYSYFTAEYPSKLQPCRKVCVLGCGSMATVGRIGNTAEQIRIVDLDEEVFKTAARFFQKQNRLNRLSNWTFHADDAKHFLANTPEKFDLILHDIPPARSRQTALTYTKEFFEQVKQSLNPEGLFSISSLRPIGERSHYSGRLLATLLSVFDNFFVLDTGSAIYFYGGTTQLKNFSEDFLKKSLRLPERIHTRVLSKEEVLAMVKDEKIITIDNVGDLIFA